MMLSRKEIISWSNDSVRIKNKRMRFLASTITLSSLLFLSRFPIHPIILLFYSVLQLCSMRSISSVPFNDNTKSKERIFTFKYSDLTSNK
ncbi:hypothetical protein BpHYR1_034096 [Brachionus plicatilis]|uniref:Uncharacterized protein n=1 Tax=Brachionus plicatilis TaxID=10195 RepID=A0A3M7PK26_BRAPC|nr:hypothetical protein BpHYR1_034096 [Brachionus plicatilis]